MSLLLPCQTFVNRYQKRKPEQVWAELNNSVVIAQYFGSGNQQKHNLQPGECRIRYSVCTQNQECPGPYFPISQRFDTVALLYEKS